MTARMRKLLEARARAWSAVQDIQARRAADGYEPTTEDGEAFTRSLDEVERLSTEIEAEERAERLGGAIERSLLTPAADQRGTNPTTGDRTDGGEEEDVAAAYRSAFVEHLRRGDVRSPEARALLEQGFVDASDELRAQGVAVDAAGGYTVPREFLTRMLEAELAFGGIEALAETMTTDNGRELSWPTSNTTAEVGAILAENTEDSELDTVFGTTRLGAFMYTSKIVRVSRQLLQDSAFDLEGWLARKLGERIGRAAATHFAVGTGTNQPQGLVTGLTQTVTTGTVGKVGYDDLVDLEHSIDAAYRGANTRYVLHDSALRELRKLKDTQGRPLWVPALAGGVPSTINGQPYTVDNALAAQANGSKSIVFGDIRRAYLVRRVNGAQTLRLNERYATSLQVGFLGFQRLDGRVQDTRAASALVIKAA